MRRPDETARGRIWLARLAVALILGGAVVSAANLPAGWRPHAFGVIFVVVFYITTVWAVRHDAPADERRLARTGQRHAAADDEQDHTATEEHRSPTMRKIAKKRRRATSQPGDAGEPAARPGRTGGLRNRIARRFRRGPSLDSTGALPDGDPAPAGTEADGTARAGSSAGPGTGDVAVSGAGSGPCANPGLEAVTVGPVTELDRTTVPVSSRVVAGARDSSVYFGGRIMGRPFEVRGASLPGLSHLLEDRPNQDCLAAGWLPHRNSLLVAAADGLGSQANSGVVATFALRRLLDLGQDPRCQQYPLAQLVEWVRRDIADKLSHDAHDGATTLVAAELRPAPGGADTDIVAVGDSEAWHLHATTWEALHHERGEGTRALPHSPAKQVVRLLLPAGTVLMLATDGVAQALSSGNSVLARELAARLEHPPRPVEFANLIEFRHEMFNDDRSAVAVWLLAE